MRRGRDMQGVQALEVLQHTGIAAMAGLSWQGSGQAGVVLPGPAMPQARIRSARARAIRGMLAAALRGPSRREIIPSGHRPDRTFCARRYVMDH